MTSSEFKAWFEGFSEGIGFTPTTTQWERIKARVAELNVNVPVVRDTAALRYNTTALPSSYGPLIGGVGVGSYVETTNYDR